VYGIRLGVIDKSRRELFYGENLRIFAVQAGQIPASKLAALGLVSIPASWSLASQTAPAPA